MARPAKTRPLGTGAAVVSAVLALLSCGAPPVDEPAAGSIADPVHRLGGAAPGAFALAATAEGALLAVGGADGVSAQPLDPVGEPRGDAAILEAAPVDELVAGAAGRRVGIGWVVVEAPASAPRVRAAFSPDGGVSFLAAQDVDDTVAVPTPGGRLAIAADDGGLVALYHRIVPAPCVASEGICARYDRFGLGADAARAGRGTEPLEIDQPCEPLLGGALWSDGSWFTSVCHVQPQPRALVFTIRPAIHYAVATELPAGCRPAGLAPRTGGALALGACPGGAVRVPLDVMGQAGPPIDARAAGARCEDGRPVVGWPGQELPLSTARGDLAPLLPPAVAPLGARAVWTGEALLIATQVGDVIELRRRRCRGGALVGG